MFEWLGQPKAYCACALALSEQNVAEFWTADERLYNRVQQIGIRWVHWIMEPL